MSHEPSITRRQFLGLPEQQQDDNERPFIYFTAEDGEIILKPAADVPYSRSSDQVKQSDDVFTRT